MKRKVCFRADASATIGFGHFIRSLALADMLKDNFDCVFYTTAPSQYQLDELRKVCHHFILHEGIKFDEFITFLDGSEIVVLDNYFFTSEYQQIIKRKGCKLVCIDDMHNKHYYADIIINQITTNSSLFDCEPYSKLCLGLEYALLRAPFLRPVSHVNRNNNIVVNFGGADPYGITERIVSLLIRMSIPNHIIVILGDKVRLSEENRKHVTVRKNLSAEQMAELFETSALGVLSASTVCIEALSRGLPAIVGFHIDNQNDTYHFLTKSDLVKPIGYLQEVEMETLSAAIKAVEQHIPFQFPIGIKERFIQAFNSI